MNLIMRFSALALVLSATAACGIFDDPTPETISVRMSGASGSEVVAIYSQIFVAGVNQETSTTEVRIQQADTVLETLPIDTIVDIRESRQFFVQVQTVPDQDSLEVAVRVDLDTRSLLQTEGLILPDDPWQYVYQFNRPLTNVVEVVF